MTLLQELLTGDTREGNNYREHTRDTRVQLSSGAEIKSTPGSGPHCFPLHDQIYHSASPNILKVDINQDMDKLRFSVMRKATTKRLEIQSNQGCSIEARRRMKEMLRQVNLFALI